MTRPLVRRFCLVALVAWCNGTYVQFPAALQKNLVLRLEADSGVVLDESSADSEPPVIVWYDQSGNKRDAAVNSSFDANTKQRARNSLEDRTRNTEGTNNLARAKRRAVANLHDSAPAYITCPILNVPALFFDGDDYMFIESQLEDGLVPGKGGMTVVAMMTPLVPEDEDQGVFSHWLGLGNPGIISDSQYTLHVTKVVPEEVFGAGGKKKAPKLIGEPKGELNMRAVPVMHDRMIPSVRKHAEIRGSFSLGKPTLVSFQLTGKGLLGRLNGEEDKFKVGQSGFSQGGWSYQGKVDPHEDVDGTSFYLGSGPSAQYLVDFTGEGAYGYLYGVLIWKGKMNTKGLSMAETYLACRFGLEDKCTTEATERLGIKEEL